MGSPQAWVLKRIQQGVDTAHIPLKPGLNRVGRSYEDNNIVCQSIWVSRHHCDITMNEGAVFIKDRGSFNGTYIEALRLESERFIELKIGDYISLGKPYKKGDDLTKDHYVYEVMAYKAPQREVLGKRRSTSPTVVPPKRSRGPSPAKVPFGKVEIVDLTVEDPPQINGERTFVNKIDNFRVPGVKTHVTSNRRNNLNATPSPRMSESFPPEMHPLASSTLINGDRNSEANKEDVPEMLKEVFGRISKENQLQWNLNTPLKEVLLDLFKPLNILSATNHDGSNGGTEGSILSTRRVEPEIVQASSSDCYEGGKQPNVTSGSNEIIQRESDSIDINNVIVPEKKKNFTGLVSSRKTNSIDPAEPSANKSLSDVIVDDVSSSQQFVKEEPVSSTHHLALEDPASSDQQLPKQAAASSSHQLVKVAINITSQQLIKETPTSSNHQLVKESTSFPSCKLPKEAISSSSRHLVKEESDYSNHQLTKEAVAITSHPSIKETPTPSNYQLSKESTAISNHQLAKEAITPPSHQLKKATALSSHQLVIDSSASNHLLDKEDSVSSNNQLVKEDSASLNNQFSKQNSAFSRNQLVEKTLSSNNQLVEKASTSSSHDLVPSKDLSPIIVNNNENKERLDFVNSALNSSVLDTKMHDNPNISSSQIRYKGNSNCIEIFKKGTGLIRKGAKRKSDTMNPTSSDQADGSKMKTFCSKDSSGEDFLGFDDLSGTSVDKGNIIAKKDSVDEPEVSSTLNEVIANSKHPGSNTQKPNNTLVRLSREEAIPLLGKPLQGKAGANEPALANSNGISENSPSFINTSKSVPNNPEEPLVIHEGKKQSSAKSCRRKVRSNSSFDAEDVAKLLHDLEKSSDDIVPPAKVTSISPEKCAKEGCVTRSKVSSKKLNEKKKKEFEKYNKLEKELRNVFGEPSQDFELSELNVLPGNNLQKEIHVDKNRGNGIIDLECFDLNNSFSQVGTDAVIEIDENDEAYSQIFSEEDNNMVDDGLEMKSMFVCSMLIKEEVDEVVEDSGLELFESHFSQCSQEIEEQLRDTAELKANEELRFNEKLNSYETGQTKITLETVEAGTSNKDTKRKKLGSSEDRSKESCSLDEQRIPDALEGAQATIFDKTTDNNRGVVNNERVFPTKEEELKKSPVIIASSSTRKNDTVISCPKNEEMTGAKLVKSTLLSKPPVPQRKRGRKTKGESSVTKEALLKRKKQQIKLERNAKLKSLALHGKASDIDSGINRDNLKVTSNKENETKVKLKDSVCEQKDNKNELGENPTDARTVAKNTERSRSTILLEGFLEEKPNTRKRARSRSKPIIQDSLDLIEKKEIIVKEKSFENKPKSCLKSPNTVSPHRRVTFDLKPMIQSFECEGILKPVNSNVSIDKAPIRTVIHSREVSFDELIKNVLHWNTSWREESKVVKGDPPVYPEVFNTKDMFVSYGDYKRWLYPLLLYELWSNMMKHMDEMEALKSTRSFKGVILQTEPRRGSDKLSTLKCCVPLQGKDIPSLIDPFDILLLYVSNAAKKCLVMFGVVMSQVKVCSVRDTSDSYIRTYLTKLNCKVDVCAYFDVVIYISPKKPVETGYSFMLRPTYNMGNEMRQYDSLVKLQTSPLLWTILDPEKRGPVSLGKEMNDKIISAYPLNEEQKRAVLCTSQAVFSRKPSISLIYGPPGTGKTRVIVAIVEQLLHRFKSNNAKKQRILLCAQTNTAIDEICLRLLEVRRQLPREKRFKLSRYGKREKINQKLFDILTTTIARNEVERMNLEEVFNLELSLLKAQERMFSYLLDNCKEYERNNYRRKYDGIQGQISHITPLVEKRASEELRKKEIDRLVSDEELKVIFHSDIIATTLGSCTSRRMLKAFNIDAGLKEDKGEIRVCIIDEATQSTDTTTLLPLLHDVKNFILVGDPQQLPPVVNSETCKKNGLSRSLFSRLYKVWSEMDPESLPDGNCVPVYKLNTQYRMHPEIVQFPSKNFYNSELITPSFLSVSRGFRPFALFTHRHTSDPDSVETNLKEAELLIDMVDGILQQPLFNGLSIGLIVPYQKQRAIVSDLVHDKKWMRLVTVSTIDSYQGQEKDIIILTCVRTNGIGFLSDYQRTNVALTRAKRGLYILGNFSSLQADPVWKKLFNNAQSRGIHLDLKSTTSAASIMDFIILDKKRKRSR